MDRDKETCEHERPAEHKPFLEREEKTFLERLKERGLTGVRLIISDGYLGLLEAVGEVLPQAALQRCVGAFASDRRWLHEMVSDHQ
jgi:Transposase, Mutator family